MSTLEETIFCSQENIDKTLLFLNDCLSWTEIPGMLTFDCFQLPTETNDKCECDWTKVVDISKEELFAQINYDLATFYFYREDYILAKEKFAQCLKYYNSVENINGFLDLDEETLTVYVKACNCFVEGSKGNLLEQLNSSIVNQYKVSFVFIYSVLKIVFELQQSNIQIFFIIYLLLNSKCLIWFCKSLYNYYYWEFFNSILFNFDKHLCTIHRYLIINITYFERIYKY